MLKVKSFAKLLKNKLKSKKIGLIIEGFGVLHVHIHLVPINSMGELNQKRTKPVNKEELNKIAKKILN